MEFKYVLLFWLCVIFPSSDSNEITNGIITSIFPNSYFPTWYPGYLRAYPGDVDTLTMKGTSVKFNPYYFKDPSTSVTSMAVDTKNECLYYLDINTRGLYRMSNISMYMNRTDTFIERFHEGTSYALGHVAFDWISENVYWTDRYHNWISMKPAYTNDTLMYKVILENQIIVPIALALDPIEGYIFWTDTMPSGRIERANLVGEDREVLIFDGLGFPTAMTVDRQNKRIYWVDSTRNTIESATYDGFRRPALRREHNHPLVDIIAYKNHICVTDQADDTVVCYDKEGSEVWRAAESWWEVPFAIAVYDPALTPDIVQNNCDSLQCGHFCVHTPTIGRCMCKEGYKLKEDNVTCEATHAIAGKGLIFTNGTNICLLDIHTITNASHKPQCIVSSLNTTKHLQADTANGIIYFSNSSGREIKQYNLQTGSILPIAPTGSVSGMFYDWISHDLYWSEDDTNTIKVAAVFSGSSKTVYSGIIKSSHVVGNPHNYSLYWLSGEDTYSYKIEGGAMKGGATYTVVENRRLKHPVGLYYDEVYNKIFWIDENELKGVTLKDGEIRTYLTTIGNARSFLVYKDYAIWTTSEADIRASFITSGLKPTYIDFTKHGAVTGMCIFDPRLQRQERGPCEDNNGGCEEICIPTKNGASCQCPLGLQLHKDGKRCQSVPRTTQFALVTEFIHHRIYQVPTKDTTIKANSIIALDLPTVRTPHGALYDPKSQFLYWAEISSQQIRRCKLNGHNESTVFRLDKNLPDRLVIDESTGNLYFTALDTTSTSYWYTEYKSYIGVLRLSDDLENIKHKAIITGLKEARSLALYPAKGYIFWGEIGSTDSGIYIGRSDMDGGNQKQIVTEVTTPIGLAIDYKANRIYWADTLTDEIKSSDLDGKDIKLFFKHEGAMVVDIAFMGNYLYYIGWNSRTISRIDKETETKTDWMPDVPELGRLDSIKLYPGDTQPQNALCRSNNGGCSTFCFPTAIGRTCSCEDGVSMRDKQNCQNVCPDAFEHGKIQQGCLIYPGATCGYTCIGHLQKNDNYKTIKCLKNATWNVNEKDLCKEIKCDKSLSSVYVTGACKGNIGDRCNYACKNGKANKYTKIMCSSGGSWLPNTDLCKDAVTPVTEKCINNIQNGKLDDRCTREVNVKCGYTCNTGYMSAYHETSVQCLSTKQWNAPLNKICIAIPPKSAQQILEEEIRDEGALIGGVLGTLIIILILIIVIGAICVVKRSGTFSFTENKLKHLQSRKTEGSPPTEFSKQVKDESSSGFENPLSKQGSAFVVIGGQQS